MEEKFERLKEIGRRLNAIGAAQSLLAWDRDVNMPPGGSENRGHTMSELGTMAQEIGTSDEVGKLIEELEPWAEEKGKDTYEGRYLMWSRRGYDQATKVPKEMVAEQIQLVNEAQQAWPKARQNNDFATFQPVLEKFIDYTHRFVDLFKPYEHPYDVMLDLYEPNMKTADVKVIFNEIRPKQVELIEAIAAAEQVDDACLHLNFPADAQVKFGREITEVIGYDYNRGRQDKVHHPYMTNLGFGDQRITYRVDENFFNPYFYAILHEAGHAMYEQGVPKDLWLSPMYGGASLAIHESQSRLWENLVGRSYAFTEFLFPKLQAAFPSQFGNVDIDTYYKAVNKVAPSLIRVEADEATYNLHIMLRLEIEIDLLEGNLAVKDLPEAWNSRFEEYLGITPPNDADGCLQDVHWSMGLFGYFSTYALGNLVSVQLWDKMLETYPNVEDEMRQGDTSNILKWMNENVHVHGSTYFPQELMQMVTGSKIDGGPYIGYLNKKYSDIYGL